jgi:hypothetical protein
MTTFAQLMEEHLQEHSYDIDGRLARWGDARFKRAMLRARACGEINFAIGVVVDLTPLVPKHYPREPQLSPMGSCALLCTQTAPREELPERQLPTMGGPRK